MIMAPDRNRLYRTILSQLHGPPVLTVDRRFARGLKNTLKLRPFYTETAEESQGKT